MAPQISNLVHFSNIWGHNLGVTPHCCLSGLNLYLGKGCHLNEFCIIWPCRHCRSPCVYTHHVGPCLAMPYGCKWSKIPYLTLRFLQRKAVQHWRGIHIKKSPAESNCSPAPLISLRWSSCHAVRVWGCVWVQKKKGKWGSGGGEALKNIGPMVWWILHPLIKGWCHRHTWAGQEERKQTTRQENILHF